MPTYLVQVSYTDAAWANLVADPHDRTEAVRPVVEGLGGRMISAYLAFGDYDVVLIIEYPDSVSAAAFSMAVAAGGAVKSIKTTPLLTIEEGIQAMRRAAGAHYMPPRAATGAGDTETVAEAPNIADVLEGLGGNP